MKTTQTPKVENHVAALRQKRRLSAALLATKVGVRRQTIYAIEAGTYVPNTAVALELARALEVSVEDLFMLPPDSTGSKPTTENATLLPGTELVQSGQPVQLCRVGETLVASSPFPQPWILPPSDATIAAKPLGRKLAVEIWNRDSDFGNRLSIAGCDPAVSLLAHHLASAGIEPVLAHRNSSQALALLKQGLVHVAGMHLRDEVSGESNLPEIRRAFPKSSVAVIALAVWEAGIVVAHGNPKSIGGIEDFVRKDVRVVNREPGAGSRKLLDSHLGRLRISPKRVIGYEQTASGHLPAAWQVCTGAADCCIATRAAASVFGLSFIPLASERYDFVMRSEDLNLPAVQTLLDTINRSRFRKELANIGGYDTQSTGKRML